MVNIFDINDFFEIFVHTIELTQLNFIAWHSKVFKFKNIISHVCIKSGIVIKRQERSSSPI